MWLSRAHRDVRSNGMFCVLLLCSLVFLVTIPQSPFYIPEVKATQVTLRPNANGVYQEFPVQYPSSGSHYQKVDETTPNDGTDYIRTSTSVLVWKRDVFTHLESGIPVGSTINYIIVYNRVRGLPTPGDIAADGNVMIRSGSTDAHGVITFAEVWTTISWQWNTDPATGLAWNISGVDNVQIGGRGRSYYDDIEATWAYWQISTVWMVIYYTSPPSGYALNLRVRDWDLTDNIGGAYVYKDSDVKASDSDGWANWTLVTGTVQIKVKYYGFWVNGTFSVAMDSDKTINVQCKLYDVTVTVQEGLQSAYLVSANVTVFNATSMQANKIKSGITGSNGQVALTNLPNNTLTFTQYGGASYTIVIGNATQSVSSESQSITLTSNQNYVGTTSSLYIIALVGSVIISRKRKGQAHTHHGGEMNGDEKPKNPI